MAEESKTSAAERKAHRMSQWRRIACILQGPADPCVHYRRFLLYTQAALRPNLSSDTTGDQSMPFRSITRRALLKLTGPTPASGLAAALLSNCGSGGGGVMGGGPGPSTCAKLSDIEHVVILIQENRSFDHYFGSYRGVRGFSEQSMAFQQPDPANVSSPPVGALLPFHLDTSTSN